MFQNSPSKGKDHANYELKDSEPGASCSNELADFTPLRETMHLRKKYTKTVRSTEGPSLIPKNQSANMVFPKTVFGKKGRSFNVNWYSKSLWLHIVSFGYTCTTAYTKRHKAVSGNSDPAFMRRGFHKWKKRSERFLDLQSFINYKNNEDLVRSYEANIDTDEQFQEHLSLEKT